MKTSVTSPPQPAAQQRPRRPDGTFRAGPKFTHTKLYEALQRIGLATKELKT